jgi:hypothetical protein
MKRYASNRVGRLPHMSESAFVRGAHVSWHGSGERTRPGLDLGSARALACSLRRLAAKPNLQNGADIQQNACAVGEGADRRTRGRVRSPGRVGVFSLSADNL